MDIQPFDQSQISSQQAGQQFHVARGTRNLGRAKNQNITWGRLCSLLGRPTVTGETFKKFMSFPKEEQDRLKNVEGWWIGGHCKDGKRSNKSIDARRIVTFDMDDCPGSVLDDLSFGLTGIAPYTFMVHSTRKHTEEKPRLRITFLLADEIPAEQYMPVCRILAQKLDPTMDMIDDVSFRLAQMMYWPSMSKDGDWFCYYNDGEMLDAAEMLAEFGDWQDFTKLPFSDKQGQKRPSAEKAENPRTKKGLVGAFCRAYTVEEAIDKFLPDVYVPGDSDSGKPRYSFLEGSTSNGVVVEDDGDFIYSHHSTDPCGDKLCNAFDMVRLHLFEAEDAKVEEGTSPGKFPSFKAMADYLEDDELIIRELANERYDMAAMFDDSDLPDDLDDEDEDDQPVVHISATPHIEFDDLDEDSLDLLGGPSDPLSKFTRERLTRAKKGWFSKELEFDQNGYIVNSMNNISQIITNDDRLHGAVAFDQFGKRVVLKRDIKSKIGVIPPLYVTDKANGDRWQDNFDIRLRALLEFPSGKKKPGYGMKVTDRDLTAGISLAADRNQFHPVRDWLLTNKNKWDGERRIDTLFIDYLGCPDLPYYREAARMIMLASVTRIFEPGCKFDHSPVLQGTQGVRKSSFISALYGEEFFGELTCKLDDVQRIAENIAGKWAIEFPELSSFYKSDHNAAKAFLSRVRDDVRMAYDRRVTDFPRQTVFWGTTNDEKYLKDPTGNRRWWIIHVLRDLIDTDMLAENRGQLWAEAVALYVEERLAKPHGALHLDLRSDEARTEAKRLQEEARTLDVADQWAEAITDWLDTPIRLSTLKLQYSPETDADSANSDIVNTMGDLMNCGDDEKTWVQRCAFRQADVMRHVLNKPDVVTTPNDAILFERALGLLTVGWGREAEVRGSRTTTRKFGIAGRWRVRRDCGDADRLVGFRVVDAPTGVDDEGSGLT